MLYKFIRTGDKPVEQIADPDIITSCFEPCTPEVQQQLRAFFDVGGDTIEFPQFNVTIKRKNAKKNNANSEH